MKNRRMRISLIRLLQSGAVALVGSILVFSDGTFAFGKKGAKPDAPSHVLKESCRDSVSKFVGDTGLPKDQRKSTWKEQYRGLHFVWNLEVIDWQKHLLGGWTANFRCVNTHDNRTDISMKFKKSDHDDFAKIEQGGTFTVRGVLKDYNLRHLVAVLDDGASPKLESANQSEVDAERSRTAKQDFITESCGLISREFGSTSTTHTDIQRESLWKKYVNKAFHWQMIVHNVGDRLGGIMVSAQCSDLSPSISLDVTLSYPANYRNLAMGFEMGKVYDFEGILRDYNKYTGLSADAIVHSPASR